MVGQSLWESSIREEATGHSGAFIAAGMECCAASQNTVCMDCYKQLTRQDRLLVTPALTGSCRLCAFQAVKPEAFTKPFCTFLTENPTIFHTVAYTKSKLEAAGYKQVSREWHPSPLRRILLLNSAALDETLIWLPSNSYRVEMPGLASLSQVASTTLHETAAL
jgi:hypothetical protein